MLVLPLGCVARFNVQQKQVNSCKVQVVQLPLVLRSEDKEEAAKWAVRSRAKFW